VPQLRQANAAARGAAHSPQNFAPSRLSLPQLGHFIFRETSRQRVEQRLGVLQVRSVEALSELAVDLTEHPPRLVSPPLFVEEAGEARRRAKLDGLRALAAGDFDGVAKTGLGFG
jgi:hypothetical protein